MGRSFYLVFRDLQKENHSSLNPQRSKETLFKKMIRSLDFNDFALSRSLEANRSVEFTPLNILVQPFCLGRSTICAAFTSCVCD